MQDNVTIQQNSSGHSITFTVNIANVPFLFDAVDKPRLFPDAMRIAREVAIKLRLHEVRIINGTSMRIIPV